MFRVLPGSHSLSERELSLLATFAEPSDGPDPYDASVVSSLAEMEDVDKFAVNPQAIPGCRRLPVEFPGVELEIGPARGFSGETRENCSFSQSVIELSEAISKPVSLTSATLVPTSRFMTASGYRSVLFGVHGSRFPNAGRSRCAIEDKVWKARTAILFFSAATL